MNNFLYRIFLFFIPVIVFFIGCEIFVRNMPSEYRQKRDQLVANADSIEVLVLGASHAMDGVDPRQIALYTHNLAFGSQSIHYDRKLVEKYLPNLIKLKYVLISLEHNSLYYDHEVDRDFFYKYYYGIPYKNRKFYKESFLQSYFVYTPQLTLSMIGKSLNNKKKVESIKGWKNDSGRNDEVVSSVERNKIRANGFNKTAKTWKGGDSVLNDLNELINFLLSKEITPILITYPTYSLFNSFIDTSIVERTRSVGNELSQRYKIPYMDFNDDDSFTIEYFFNCDHLNEQGAAKLSQKINEVIMNMEEKHINIEKNIVPLPPESP